MDLALNNLQRLIYHKPQIDNINLLSNCLGSEAENPYKTITFSKKDEDDLYTVLVMFEARFIL